MEQRLIRLQGMTVQNQMGSYKGDRPKIRCGKGRLIRCLSTGRSFRLLQTTCSRIIGICKLFSCNAKQHMPFWLLKEA